MTDEGIVKCFVMYQNLFAITFNLINVLDQIKKKIQNQNSFSIFLDIFLYTERFHFTRHFFIGIFLLSIFSPT